jgi:hypothetical protein
MRVHTTSFSNMFLVAHSVCPLMSASYLGSLFITLIPNASEVYWIPMGLTHLCLHFSDSSITWPQSKPLFNHTDFSWSAPMFSLPFVHRHGRRFLKTYSKSSWPEVLIVSISNIYAYPEPSNFCLKPQKNNPRGFCQVLAPASSL